MEVTTKRLINRSKPDGTEIDLSYTKTEKVTRMILYIFDTLLLSLIFLFFGLGFSAFINAFICKTLDTTKSKLHLFFESSWESLAIILVIFFLLFYIPKVPSIVPFPNKNHMKFRLISRHIVIAFAIVMAHQRLLLKYQYLLGVDS
jgi:hypothetical protein